MKYLILLFFASLSLLSFNDLNCSCNEKSVKKYWDCLLETMCEGDVKKFENMATDNGFKSIILNAPKENYKKELIDYCKLFNSSKISFEDTNDNEAYIIVGEDDPKNSKFTSAIKLKCINGFWKLDDFMRSK